MWKSLLVIGIAAMSNVAAADLRGNWAGTMETKGHQVTLFMILAQHDQHLSGSMSTADSLTPTPIENAEVTGDQLAFELHDRADRLVKFRLTLTGAVLSGQAAVDDKLSKVSFSKLVTDAGAPPVLIRKVSPKYTTKALQAKIEGTVNLYVQIAPNGTATNIKVIHSLGFGLDEKAVECVKKWKFKPGYKDGDPVTVEATIEVNFRLLSR